MKLIQLTFILLSFFGTQAAFAQQPIIMNPGFTKGQLVFLTEADLVGDSEKLQSLNQLSIPVFERGELAPLDLSVVAGSITLTQQGLLSHVQLKAQARGTPNLDLHQFTDGFQSSILAGFNDGDWVEMNLPENTVEQPSMVASSEDDAQQYWTDRIPM